MACEVVETAHTSQPAAETSTEVSVEAVDAGPTAAVQALSWCRFAGRLPIAKGRDDLHRRSDLNRAQWTITEGRTLRHCRYGACRAGGDVPRAVRTRRVRPRRCRVRPRRVAVQRDKGRTGPGEREHREGGHPGQGQRHGRTQG